MFSRADDVVRAAMVCIGTPFKHQGRLPGVGLDCAGLGIVAARAAGVNVEDFSGYPRLPFDGMLKKMFDGQEKMCEIPVAEMCAGDVLLMRMTTAPQHVAIYAGDGFMIHAYRTVGMVVRQRMDSDWRKKVIAAYRFSL